VSPAQGAHVSEQERETERERERESLDPFYLHFFAGAVSWSLHVMDICFWRQKAKGCLPLLQRSSRWCLCSNHRIWIAFVNKPFRLTFPI
jgi:hypothetical protein